MTISTPALDAIRQQLAVEQLALRDEAQDAEAARAAYLEASAIYEARLETVASLEASLAALAPQVDDAEPEGAA